MTFCRRLQQAIAQFEVDYKLVRLGLVATAALIGIAVVYYAFVGYRVRSRFQRLQKQGVVCHFVFCCLRLAFPFLMQQGFREGRRTQQQEAKKP